MYWFYQNYRKLLVLAAIIVIAALVQYSLNGLENVSSRLANSKIVESN